MADYLPPVGTVNLDLTGAYTPPVGTVNLDLTGAYTPPVGSADRALTVTARTGGARAAIRVRPVLRLTLAARTQPPRAIVTAVYDPNLLSPVHALTGEHWRDGPLMTAGVADAWRPSISQWSYAVPSWRAAPLLDVGGIVHWQDARWQTGSGDARWRAAASLREAARTAWGQSVFFDRAACPMWRDAVALSGASADRWQRTLPRLTPDWGLVWREAGSLRPSWRDNFGDGRWVALALIEGWRQGTYPSNALREAPPIPPTPDYTPPIGLVVLDLRCPAPTSPGLMTLNFDRSPCPLIPVLQIPIIKVYRVLNSCSLVRLPDRTPLPVTSMTLETDTDSWCWALSATLATASGWEWVRPMPPAFLPVEVEATINGHVWRFLLDQPSATRGFGQHRQALKGRSRSAWLHDPFTARTLGVESNPRTVQQLAEQALTNLGWTLIWQLPTDWLIPGGVYSWSATPMEQLLNLVKPVDGCLYTDPQAAILTAYPRYPTPAWLWDGQIADVGIPEDALATLDRAPDHRPIINGCYVSGVQYGHVAWVKVAGTDGALIPPEPVVDPLLTSPDALRLRGLSILSASGPGHTLSATMQLTPSGGSGPGLLRPGQLVAMASVRGRVRSVRVTAEWSQGLKVRQSVSIERREVEP